MNLNPVTRILVWLSPVFNWLYANVNGPLFWGVFFAILISGGGGILLWERRKKK